MRLQSMIFSPGRHGVNEILGNDNCYQRGLAGFHALARYPEAPMASFNYFLYYSLETAPQFLWLMYQPQREKT